MLLFKNLLGKALSELPTSTRLIVLMPIIALIAVCTFATKLWVQSGNRNTADIKAKDEQILYLKKQVEIRDHIIELKDYRNDSLVARAYNDKVETNRKLELIIEKQDKQKNLLRK